MDLSIYKPAVDLADMAWFAEGIVVRKADEFDLPSIESLQKRHSEELGYFNRQVMAEKLERQEILVAREATSKRFAGYVIASDSYQKRQEVGIIYQMGVHERFRRRGVAASLLKGLWASWPRGVRLCSAWCAQDLVANRFWESMGFVPLAYRAGSEKGRKLEDGSVKPEDSDSGPSGFKLPASSFPSNRVHLFWQARTTHGDETPWWYPSLTGNGALRADRVVLPVPTDQHWSQTRPAVLPTVALPKEPEEVEPFEGKSRKYADGVSECEEGLLWRDGKRLMTPEQCMQAVGASQGGPWMVPPDVELVRELPRPLKKEKRAKKVHDPRLVAFARDLRDDWLEHVNGQRLLAGESRYAAQRQLPASPFASLPEQERPKLLAA